jgi:Lon protease-like protein
VGEVEFFHDSDGEAPGLAELAGAVRSRFEEFVHALQGIAQPTAEVEMPADPIALSFHVAAVLEMDAENKEALFRLTSVVRRLERLKELLDAANVDVARHAAIHKLAKRNGKAGHLGASGT